MSISRQKLEIVQQNKGKVRLTNEPQSNAEKNLQTTTDTHRNGAKNKKDKQLARALGWFSIGLGVAEFVAPKGVARLIGIEGDHSVLFRVLGLREIASGIGILTQHNKPAPWLWSRVAGDAMDLALLGAALTSNNSRRGKVIAATAAVASVTALDLLCSQHLSQTASADGTGQIISSITIGKSADELYRLWHEPQTLSQIIGDFAEINAIDETHAHWTVKGPLGQTLECDTQITEDRPGKFVRWQTSEGATLPHEATVSFSPAPSDRGTEVMLHFHFDTPGGALGAVAENLFSIVPNTIANNALRRFKSLAETGEIPTTNHQPAARNGGRDE